MTDSETIVNGVTTDGNSAVAVADAPVTEAAPVAAVAVDAAVTAKRRGRKPGSTRPTLTVKNIMARTKKAPVAVDATLGFAIKPGIAKKAQYAVLSTANGNITGIELFKTDAQVNTYLNTLESVKGVYVFTKCEVKEKVSMTI